jgi:high-affinity Fe2+/Pb2+ permease
MLVLSLLVLRYVDETALPARLKAFARYAAPTAAILLPSGFFFSILAPSATQPNALIYLAYAGALVLAAGLIVLRIGLLRNRTG